MQWIRQALAKPGVRHIPLEPQIAVACSNLPFEMHPDPADRILVATARHLGATLVTADERLLELAAKGHFQTLNAERQSSRTKGPRPATNAKCGPCPRCLALGPGC